MERMIKIENVIGEQKTIKVTTPTEWDGKIADASIARLCQHMLSVLDNAPSKEMAAKSSNAKNPDAVERAWTMLHIDHADKSSIMQFIIDNMYLMQKK